MRRYSRLLALLILSLPLFLAAYGWTLLRESTFYIFYLMQPDGSLKPAKVAWQLAWHLLGGTVFLLAGLAFLGGFFWHRQRKKSRPKWPEHENGVGNNATS